MLDLRAVDVFHRPGPGPGVAERWAVPGVRSGRLLLQPIGHAATSANAARRGTRVFSVSIFLFPGRANGPWATDYATMVSRYLAGLQVAAANMDRFPGWVLRVYVDASAVLPSLGAGLAEMVRAGLEAAAAAAPRGALQLVAVRYLRDGYEDGTTFLPAVWRFLPLLDDRVGSFVCWDADTPPHPFFVQRIERWDNRGGDAAATLYFPFEDHRTDWCGLYVGTHIGAPGLGEHAVCPLAQMWAARRTGPAGGLFSAATVDAMLAMTLGGTPLHAFLSGVTPEGLRRLAIRLVGGAAQGELARG